MKPFSAAFTDPIVTPADTLLGLANEITPESDRGTRSRPIWGRCDGRYRRQGPSIGKLACALRHGAETSAVWGGMR